MCAQTFFLVLLGDAQHSAQKRGLWHRDMQHGVALLLELGNYIFQMQCRSSCYRAMEAAGDPQWEIASNDFEETASPSSRLVAN